MQQIDVAVLTLQLAVYLLVDGGEPLFARRGSCGIAIADAQLAFDFATRGGTARRRILARVPPANASAMRVISSRIDSGTSTRSVTTRSM